MSQTGKLGQNGFKVGLTWPNGLNRAEHGQRVQRDQKMSNRTKQVQTRLKSTKQGQIGLSGTKWGRTRPDGAKQGQKGQNRV